MGLNFKIAGKTADEVKATIEGHLKTKGVPPVADISWQGNEMHVRIDKGGKSEFRLALTQEGGDCRVVETKRDVAFLHKPFVGKVETFVGDLMSTLGAKKV
jgi:hypothetical protein